MAKYEVLQMPTDDSLIPYERLPRQLREAIEAQGRPAAKADAVRKNPPGWVVKALAGVAQGERDSMCIRLAGYLRNRVPREVTLAILLDFAAKCNPPLDEATVRKCVESAYKYQGTAGEVSCRVMAEVVAVAVDWLWKPYIPLGKLTLLEGDPGVGKSWVSLAIARGVSLGRGLPGMQSGAPGKALLASAEDGLGDTIRPRLDAMKADVNRIVAIDTPLTLDDAGFAQLEGCVDTHKPSLLILDPLVAYLGAGVDIHRANETRAVMAQLARLAERFGIAVVAVRHLTKGGMSKAIYRGLGSIDITAACRSVLLAGCEAENSGNRALVHIKSNLALAGPSIGYELKDGCFYWTGESSLTAAQILAADNGAGTSELDEAVAFLRGELADGRVPAKDVYRDAQDMGVSRRTLERAKVQAGIIVRREGEKGKRGGGGWAWKLPDDLHRQDTAPSGQKQSYGDLHRQDRQHTEVGDVNRIEAEDPPLGKVVGDLNNQAPGLPPLEELARNAVVAGHNPFDEGRGGDWAEVVQ